WRRCRWWDDERDSGAGMLPEDSFEEGIADAKIGLSDALECLAKIEQAVFSGSLEYPDAADHHQTAISGRTSSSSFIEGLLCLFGKLDRERHTTVAAHSP